MRKKTKKLRGRKTAGWGARKKHKGKGSRGGKGMAGTGKRADQKKSFILKKFGKEYFGKRGFVSLKSQKKSKKINLDQLNEMLPLLIKNELAKKIGQEVKVDLKKAGYGKLLGRGKVTMKYLIKVDSFSKNAQEKIEKFGGSINKIEAESKEEKKEEK